MAYTVKPKIRWANQQDLDKLAEALVQEFACGTRNEELSELLSYYRDGGTYRGKQIYLRKLLGIMSSMCPELVDAVSTEAAPSAKPKFRD